MQLAIVFLFALCILGVQSGCYHHYGQWGWQFSTNHPNYQCVQRERCYDDQYNLTNNQKWVTQNGHCIIHSNFIFGQVCCLHRSPPPRRTQNFITRTPTRNPSLRPMNDNPQQISSQDLNRNPRPQLEQPSSTQSQSQGLPEITPSPNTNCNCIPSNECHDTSISNNLAGLLDPQYDKKPLREESCPNTNHVCCHQLVLPLSPTTRNPSPQPKPQSPSQIFTQSPTIAPSSRPKPQSPSQIFTQRPTLGTSSRPEPQLPSQISHQSHTVGPSSRPQSFSPAHIPTSSNSNCLCTPFYKCYDEETSSNITGVVNDRSFIPVTKQEACSDPNEICCHNLVKPKKEPDCAGSCVPIQECSYLSNKLNGAQRGNLNAIQELRKSVCSNTNGNLRVCCPATGVFNPFGVKFQDN